jgi:di/tricarboxylate transporter
MAIAYGPGNDNLSSGAKSGLPLILQSAFVSIAGGGWIG